MTIVKRFTYRGNNDEEFSNTYHFTGAPPVTDPEWDTVASSVIASEQPVFDGSVTFVRAIGHNSSDPGAIAVYDHDYTSPGPPPAGTFVGAGGHPGAGDQAAVVEWLTNLKSVRGKPVYLRKFLHRPYITSADPDTLEPDYAVALTAYGNAYVGAGGFGGLTNPEKTAAVVSSKVLPSVTTRTLKKRGKRKKVA
jgi:hypothetical protein